MTTTYCTTFSSAYLAGSLAYVASSLVYVAGILAYFAGSLPMWPIWSFLSLC